jgi:hypothetical protein
MESKGFQLVEVLEQPSPQTQPMAEVVVQRVCRGSSEPQALVMVATLQEEQAATLQAEAQAVEVEESTKVAATAPLVSSLFYPYRLDN